MIPENPKKIEAFDIELAKSYAKELKSLIEKRFVEMSKTSKSKEAGLALMMFSLTNIEFLIHQSEDPKLIVEDVIKELSTFYQKNFQFQPKKDPISPIIKPKLIL
jgi:hypothetical protein